MTLNKVLLIVAAVLVTIGAAILAGWAKFDHPGAWLAFGAAAWLWSQV